MCDGIDDGYSEGLQCCICEGLPRYYKKRMVNGFVRIAESPKKINQNQEFLEKTNQVIDT